MTMSCIRRFRRDEDGAVMTIEAILWFPLMFFILVTVCDFSIFYMNKARLEAVVGQSIRGYAVGAFEDCAATEDFLTRQASIIAPTAQAVCREDGVILTATLQFPASDVTLSGDKGLLRSVNLSVSRSHLTER